MSTRLMRLFIAVVGGAIGAGLVTVVDSIFTAIWGLGLQTLLVEWAYSVVYVAGTFITAIIFYFLSPQIMDQLAKMLNMTEEMLATMPLMDIIMAVVGLIVGLLVAFLLSLLMNNIPLPWLVTPINIGLYILCGYLGVSTVLKRRSELRMPAWAKSGRHTASGAMIARPKVLDTSVLIDGRVCDICETGVVEGTLVVPGFVLKELRHIADSADQLKRVRGRRGLDILQRMQAELKLPVKVEEKDYDDIEEVDLKLLRLAQDLRGVVVTNDYNLNKVAAVQQVPVLNINDLANAIKPVVLPGEEMQVTVVKEGKESGQGIAYMDDGTMIVVEGGRKLIGETITAVVTSVLQTSAGRMIFAAAGKGQ